MHDEDLLGYLLDALDVEERQQIERALRHDLELRRRLERLREQLPPREPVPCEPPAGLAEQTCDLVEGCHVQCRDTGWTSRDPCVGRRGCSLADLAMAVGVFLASAMLFFPVLANSRYRSHLHACQFNLQRLGAALRGFSQLNQGRFPAIPVSGNRAAAGIFGPVLLEQEFLVDSRILVCPGSRLAREPGYWSPPTLEEIDRAEGQSLKRLHRRMGGSYGYTLGYRIGDRYFPPRDEGRSHYALVSDTPSLHLSGRRSNNHCGLGQNVVFEDGHVEFIVDPVEVAPRNALFVNRFGVAEAGADKDDYVIGRSDMPPLLPGSY